MKTDILTSPIRLSFVTQTSRYIGAFIEHADQQQRVYSLVVASPCVCVCVCVCVSWFGVVVRRSSPPPPPPFTFSYIYVMFRGDRAWLAKRSDLGKGPLAFGLVTGARLTLYVLRTVLPPRVKGNGPGEWSHRRSMYVVSQTIYVRLCFPPYSKQMFVCLRKKKIKIKNNNGQLLLFVVDHQKY